MEDRNAPVMGYPREFLTAMGQHRAQLNHAAAPTTTTSSSAIYPFPVQAPPTHYNNRRSSHAPPLEGERKFTTCQSWACVIIFCGFCASIVTICAGASYSNPPKIRVDSVTVSALNVSAMHAVSAKWNMRFFLDIVNENNYYKEAQVSVFYKEVKLSSMPILPSNLHNSWLELLMVSESSSSSSPSSSSVSVTEEVAKAIELDRSNGVVNFTMIIDGFSRRKKWFTKYKKMRITCEDVELGFSHNATAGLMLGESRKCELHN